MEIYLGIGGGILLLLLILIGYIATLPSEFRVERGAQVDASADVIFAIINDLRQWGRWSPYDHRDPAMKKTYEGSESGPGAKYSWNGNKQVGEGSLTIVESKPGEYVAMKLDFSRPFKCSNQVRFTIVPAASGCKVTWVMEGRNNFVAKAFSLMMNMDKMVGKDFEQGLANLDKACKEKL